MKNRTDAEPIKLFEGDERAELVKFAQSCLSSGNSAIAVIKALRDRTNCSLAAAKDIYVQAQHGIGLERYQEELLSDIEEIFP